MLIFIISVTCIFIKNRKMSSMQAIVSAILIYLITNAIGYFLLRYLNNIALNNAFSSMLVDALKPFYIEMIYGDLLPNIFALIAIAFIGYVHNKINYYMN